MGTLKDKSCFAIWLWFCQLPTCSITELLNITSTDSLGIFERSNASPYIAVIFPTFFSPEYSKLTTVTSYMEISKSTFCQNLASPPMSNILNLLSGPFLNDSRDCWKSLFLFLLNLEISDLLSSTFVWESKMSLMPTLNHQVRGFIVFYNNILNLYFGWWTLGRPNLD